MCLYQSSSTNKAFIHRMQGTDSIFLLCCLMHSQVCDMTPWHHPFPFQRYMPPLSIQKSDVRVQQGCCRQRMPRQQLVSGRILPAACTSLNACPYYSRAQQMRSNDLLLTELRDASRRGR